VLLKNKNKKYGGCFMKCNRLKSLIRDWYQEVTECSLSPQRMVEKIKNHIKHCETCKNDEHLPYELEEVKEILKKYSRAKWLEDFGGKEHEESDIVSFFKQENEFIFSPEELYKDET